MKYGFIIFCLLVFTNSWGCLNGYHTSNKHGQKFEFSRDVEKTYEPFMAEFDSAYHHKLLFNLKSRNETEFKFLSDIRIYELKCGNYEAGLDLFQKLYLEHPQEYNILANLGTAYELNGELDSSHRGSEYVHIKILKAKIKLQENPNYLNQYKFLKYDFSSMPHLIRTQKI